MQQQEHGLVSTSQVYMLYKKEAIGSSKHSVNATARKINIF